LKNVKQQQQQQQQEQQEQQEQQTEIFWTSNLHRSLHFLRRRRRTHTDFENAASGDAGEAAALEPRREHVDVGIACSRPKDDDSFPQTSL